MTVATDYAERTARLEVSLADLDNHLAAAADKRRRHSLDAATGSRDALKAIAAADAEGDKLRRERETVVTALIQLKEQAIAEERAETVKQDAALRTRAANLARNASAFNQEIDAHLEGLAALLSQRSQTLRELAATDVADRTFVNRLLGKDALTAALHAHGIHRYAAVVVGAPNSARPMSDANRHLAVLGKAPTEND